MSKSFLAPLNPNYEIIFVSKIGMLQLPCLMMFCSDRMFTFHTFCCRSSSLLKAKYLTSHKNINGKACSQSMTWPSLLTQSSFWNIKPIVYTRLYLPCLTSRWWWWFVQTLNKEPLLYTLYTLYTVYSLYCIFVTRDKKPVHVPVIVVIL